MKKKIELAMSVCLIISTLFLTKQGALYVTSEIASEEKICIVIDAGHGGNDPGKISSSGAKEKDINLSIALQLQNLLEQKGVNVVLTRDSDIGLHPEDCSNKKATDMQNRCQIITEVNPVFTISIHQNSYTSPDIKGAQVFYYAQSTDGEKLAKTLQKNLISRIDPTNKRQAKANESYYLLKKTPTPTVIVECGFLSNPQEAQLLQSTEYQSKLARAIYMGILEYLNMN